jgi:hypothetical protein
MRRSAALSALIIVIVSVFLVAMGISIVERVRFLRLKSEHIDSSLDDGPSSPEKEKRWLRAVADHVKAMNNARSNADLALTFGLLSGGAFLLLIFLAPRDRH